MSKLAMSDNVNNSCVISTTEEIIEEARNGRIFILIDDEDRENEGDLIIPADRISAEAVNFMIKEGRGLVCLAMAAEIADHLELPMMPRRHESKFGTAFTVSIEARQGVTTGISASDRAHTIRTAVDPNTGPDDISIPGHVFPLRAKEGGVLSRAGHTEAAVDIAALSGFSPAGVICEIMNEDGSMARLQDLIPFAKRFGLKIGTVSDLVNYRLSKGESNDR